MSWGKDGLGDCKRHKIDGQNIRNNVKKKMMTHSHKQEAVCTWKLFISLFCQLAQPIVFGDTMMIGMPPGPPPYWQKPLKPTKKTHSGVSRGKCGEWAEENLVSVLSSSQATMLFQGVSCQCSNPIFDDLNRWHSSNVLYFHQGHLRSHPPWNLRRKHKTKYVNLCINSIYFFLFSFSFLFLPNANNIFLNQTTFYLWLNLSKHHK